MTSVEFTMQYDVHGRGITYFVQKANEFKSTIWVEFGEHRGNAKSFLNILSMEISDGSVLKLTADGVDEEEAVRTLSGMLQGPQA